MINIIKAAVLAAALILTTGCVGSPARICMMKPESIAMQSTENLACAYQMMHQEKVLDELLKRNAFSEGDVEKIKQKRIWIGMSTAALYAAKGRPLRTNRSVGAWGIHIQHVYGFQPPYSYAYTRNGKVTSWQN